jgi:hypothetical protein
MLCQIVNILIDLMLIAIAKNYFFHLLFFSNTNNHVCIFKLTNSSIAMFQDLKLDTRAGFERTILLKKNFHNTVGADKVVPQITSETN